MSGVSSVYHLQTDKTWARVGRTSISGTYVRPSGVGYTRYEDLGTTDIRTAFHSVPNGTALTLPSGTFSFSDFSDPQGYYNGVRATKYTTGWSGNGIDQTVFEMVPNTGMYVPPTTEGQSNLANLMAIFTDGTSKPSLVIEGFTLRGTTQSTTQYYSGLMVAYAVNPVIRNVFFDGCGPGYGYFPPGETGQLGTLHCSGALVENCTFDGKGVGASLLAANYDSNVTWTNCSVYSSTGTNSGMPTSYSTNGLTTYNLKVRNGKTGINHEEDSGPIRHYNPDLAVDRASHPYGFHMSFATTSYAGDNPDIEIHWDGAPTVDTFPGANGCFVFVIPDTYSSPNGSGEAQVSMPKIYVAGNLLNIISIPSNGSITGSPNPMTTAFRFHN